MKKKALVLLLVLSLVIGTFAGLTFMSASATEDTGLKITQIPVGEELVSTSATAWMKYWVKTENPVATDGPYFTTFNDGDGTADKHFAQMDPVPYVAGTNLPVAGATKYFAIAKKSIVDDGSVSYPQFRERLVFSVKTTSATDAGLDDAANKDNTYIASVWVKLPEATTETVKVNFATSQYAVNVVGSPKTKSEELTLTTEWQQLTWAFNPDASNNELYFGLALNVASAIDFVGLSIKKAADGVEFDYVTEGAGTIEGPANALLNSQVTLKAVSNGAAFVGWYVGGEKVSSDANWTFTVNAETLASNTITAKFSNLNISKVPVGNELADTSASAWAKYWVKNETTTATDGVYFTSFDNDGTEKHLAQFATNPYIAGTNLPVAGATKYFALPKRTIPTTATNSTLRERVVIFSKTTGSGNSVNAGLDDEPNREKTYIISTWVKLPEATTETVQAYFATSRWSVNVAGSPKQQSQKWPLTTEWQYISWVFNPDTTNADDNQKEMFFGLALDKASAIDFMPISLKEVADGVAFNYVTEGAGTIEGPSAAAIGEQVTLNAVANGSAFEGWYVDGKKVSSDASWTFTVSAETLTSNTITAKFVEIVVTPEPVYVGDGNELVTNGNGTTNSVKINGTGSGFYSHGAGTQLLGTAYDGDVDGNGNVFVVPPRSQNATGNRVWINDFTLEAGKYIFTCYVKADTTTDIKFGFAAGSSKYPGNDTNPKTINLPAGEWVKFTYMTDDLAAGTYALGFMSTASSAALNIYVDSISLQKAIIAPEPTPEPTPIPTPVVPQVETDGYEFVVNGNGDGTMTLTNSGTSGPGGNCTFTLVEVEDHGGNGKAYKSTPRDNNAAGGRWWFNTTESMTKLGGSGTYVATVWVKTSADCTIYWGMHTSWTHTDRPSFLVPANQWVKLVAVAELDKDTKYIPMFAVSAGDIEVLIDDVSVQRAAVEKAPATIGNGVEIVLNGNGTASTEDKVQIKPGAYSDIYRYDDAGATYNLGNDVVEGADFDGNNRYFSIPKSNYSGNNAALIKNLPFCVQITKYGETNWLTTGKTYVVSAYVKLSQASSANVMAFFGTAYYNANCSSLTGNTKNSAGVTLTTEWQQVTFVFTCAGDTGEQAATDRYLGLALSAPAAIDVDCISIQEIGAANSVNVTVKGGDQDAIKLVNITSASSSIVYYNDYIKANVLANANFTISIKNNDNYRIAAVYYADQKFGKDLALDGVATIPAYGTETTIVVELEDATETPVYATLKYIVDTAAPHIFAKIAATKIDAAYLASNTPALYGRTLIGYKLGDTVIAVGAEADLITALAALTADAELEFVYELNAVEETAKPVVTVTDSNKAAIIPVDGQIDADGKVEPFAIVTFKATGENFAYWKDAAGNVVSTKENYTCYITGNVELTPVYVGEEGYDEDKAGDAQLAAVTIKAVNTNDGKVAFIADRSAAKDKTITKFGIIIAEFNKAELVVEDKGSYADGRVIVSERTNSTTPNGTYIVTKGDKDASGNAYEAGKVLYARAYVVVEGTYIYSAQVEVSFN